MDVQRFTYNRLKVTFDTNVRVLNMCVWSFAYRAARIGKWREEYLDRKRFEKRIQDIEKILSPILTREHRMRLVGGVSSGTKSR